jgi:hypothetical protein
MNSSASISLETAVLKSNPQKEYPSESDHDGRERDPKPSDVHASRVVPDGPDGFLGIVREIASAAIRADNGSHCGRQASHSLIEAVESNITLLEQNA